MIQSGQSFLSRCDLDIVPRGVIPDLHRTVQRGNGAACIIGRPGDEEYSVCMHERWPVLLPRSCIPDLHRPVNACRGDLCAIWRPGQRCNTTSMTCVGHHLFSSDDIPDPHRIVSAVEGYVPSIR